MPSQIRATITDDEAKALADAPERGLQSVPWLVVQIVRQWLGDPQRRMPTAPPPGNANPTGIALEIARRREAIVLRWRRYMQGKRRAKNNDVATQAFLRGLAPANRVSRSTLYHWGRRHAAHGVAGLVDCRLAGASRPVQRVRCHTPAPPDASSGVWISRFEAAKRSRLNLGHIRKLCAQKFAPLGLARKVRSAASGAPTWELREDARPAFAAPVEEIPPR